MDFIHFIGKQHYPTPQEYAKEAREYGATRRLPLQQMYQMDFGDHVHCAMRDGKSALLFGYFRIQYLSGISSVGIVALQRAGLDMQPTTPPAKVKVHRMCGSYVHVATFTINPVTGERLADIAKVLYEAQQRGDDVGKPMVGGEWHDGVDAYIGGHFDDVRLKSVPFTRGFRPFDWAAFRREVLAVTHGTNTKRPSIKGHFYVGKHEYLQSYAAAAARPIVWGAKVQLVDHYQTAKEREEAANE